MTGSIDVPAVCRALNHLNDREAKVKEYALDIATLLACMKSLDDPASTEEVLLDIIGYILNGPGPS